MRELPPSAKLVYEVVRSNGVLTRKQLAEKTLLPQRTINYALLRLKNAGMLREHPDYDDLRQKKYFLFNGKNVTM